MITCPNCKHEFEIEEPASTAEVKAMAEMIYAIYPKKLGKQKGIVSLMGKLKKKRSDYDEILRATKRYKKYCADNNTDVKYIKQFSTFVNSWQDFGDENYAEVLEFPNNASDWDNAHT